MIFPSLDAYWACVDAVRACCQERLVALGAEPGWWIELAVRRKRASQKLRLLHFLVAIAFMLTFIVHV